ncbi:Por secretion system C-terminal sorting domain-containing protein [Reichenbachiella agariperforans]|uniref:Por secretion system C-terminal sorting domain-containing protein n=1 Tax=Reichenbachiella agariperforans TaxID=156994 RepID=A0A1M6LZ16_REIAG|nr:RICIN domain-containing protein [Reichenbachiella agariperforans]SHJ76412.1 Por secretion system C-terminal sorting domain-containing protein [Reichenbachiella agariperforans]
MKELFLLTALALCLMWSHQSNAQTYVGHDFNGDFGPFERTYSSMSNRVNFVSNRIQCDWWEGLYDGGNTSKKSEFRIDNNDWTYTQEFWTGFWMKIHTNTFANSSNTEMSVFQIWGFRPDGAANHYVHLEYNSDGQLILQHRYNITATYDKVIQNNFPKGKFVRVVMRIKLREYNKGIAQVWIDDELKLDRSDLILGFGDQTAASGQVNGSYSVPGSWGIYAYDNANYVNNETRTVTYDEVSIYRGANGYDIVNPLNCCDGGSNSSGGDFRFVKGNATGYAIDGGGNHSNGATIELYTNVNHNNLTWTEIDRGNGYYSYQKKGTNYCIDGGSGGANGQDVYLWSCSDNNQNQHWKKIDVGGGHYLLQKRNAPNYAIDGGGGGAINQNVYLWTMNTNNQNQHWRFDAVSSSAREISNLEPEILESAELKLYPNPASDHLTVELSEHAYRSFVLYNIDGKVYKDGDIDPDLQTLDIDLNALHSGVYILKLEGDSTAKTLKVMKQ